MKKNEKIEDLRFSLNEMVSNILIEMVCIRQLLKYDNTLSEDKRLLLENELRDLTLLFEIEFKKSNEDKLKEYHDFINM